MKGMSAADFRDLPRAARTEVLLRAIRRALEGSGYTSRGPAPGFHGSSQCGLWEKDGQSYVISCKATRGRWIAYQPTLDPTRTRLLAVRSLDDADKVCAAL